MSLKVYNTLTGKKEEFIPLNKDGKKVNMYVCGVTVYDDCHIGHARGALTFDIIRNYLKYKGYDVKYVRNITDIDDKIIERSNELNIPWYDLVGKYIVEYYKDMAALGIKKADMEPKATEHIKKDIVGLVSQLIDKGYAYEVDGDVYFEVRKFEGYGKLSGRRPDDMLSGARIAVDERKRDPLDFALWKSSKPGEPSWDSPWGKGRPGWHIECSAMSMSYLGESFDIHGGGKDLIFPHHENEIAQSEAATGKPFVKYWLHNGFVQVDKEKMSKSLGNFFTIKDILKKYPAEVVRFFLLSTHYRNPIDFSDARLEEARKNLEGFCILMNTLKRQLESVSITPLSEVEYTIKNLRGEKSDDESDWHTPDFSNEKNFLKQIEGCRKNFEVAMDDDFNTAEAIGYLNKLRTQINRFNVSKTNPLVDKNTLLKEAIDILKKLGKILGLFEEKKAVLPIPEEEINSLLDKRNKARENKDWVTADAVRKKLDTLGIILEDRAGGTIWRVKS